MDERELRDLRESSNWEDVDQAPRPPVKSPRAVVSVAFSRDDLSQVAAAAQRHEMRTSEFIRHAALACVDAVSRPQVTIIRSVSHAAHVDLVFRTPSEGKSAGRVKSLFSTEGVESSFVTT